MNLHSGIRQNNKDQMNVATIQSPEQNQDKQARNRTKGHVIRCDGKSAVISALSDIENSTNGYWAVGQLISIIVGNNRVVGLIYNLEMPTNDWNVDGENHINIHIELVGEITYGDNNLASFKGGISSYPHLGAIAHKIRTADLAAIYENSNANTVKLGTLTQDATIPALVSIDSLVSRHFAVVGTTGVGKSTSVAMMVRKIVEKRADIRTLILDPHNEFAAAFPNLSISVDASTLDLPYWMFTFEEFIEVIFRGRKELNDEIDALRDLIPEAKYEYINAAKSKIRGSQIKRSKANLPYTADTPIPYRIRDLLVLIDHKIGQLEGKSARPHLKSLKMRLESIMNDPHYRFMFENKSNADAMNCLLTKVFRIPQNGKPICVFELSGLPSEVVNVVVSVMCRLAFDVGRSSQGALPILVICEEAHRYIPNDKEAGFLPTRQAIARIAKEGRKYGVFLGVISQRPGELDTTILSQCNTIFSMRLGNDYDQDIVKKAITGAANSTASFLSSLANRECIAFGEAIGTPMRMTFDEVKKEHLPGSQDSDLHNNTAKTNSAMYLSCAVAKMQELGTGDPVETEDDITTLPQVSVVKPGDQRPTVNIQRKVKRPYQAEPGRPNQSAQQIPHQSENWPGAIALPIEIRDDDPSPSPQNNNYTDLKLPDNAKLVDDTNRPAPSSAPKSKLSITSNLARAFRNK